MFFFLSFCFPPPLNFLSVRMQFLIIIFIYKLVWNISDYIMQNLFRAQMSAWHSLSQRERDQHQSTHCFIFGCITALFFFISMSYYSTFLYIIWYCQPCFKVFKLSTILHKFHLWANFTLIHNFIKNLTAFLIGGLSKVSNFKFIKNSLLFSMGSFDITH